MIGMEKAAIPIPTAAADQIRACLALANFPGSPLAVINKKAAIKTMMKANAMNTCHIRLKIGLMSWVTLVSVPCGEGGILTANAIKGNANKAADVNEVIIFLFM